MNLMGWFLFLWIALGAACATPSGTHTVTEEGQTVANNIPKTCVVYGKTYQVGDVFKPSDSCNYCKCLLGEKIVCTLKSCDLAKK